MINLKLSLILGVLLVTVARLWAAEFHVTADASGKARGSIANPWSLEYALSRGCPVRPGDTIWIHGGTYTGPFVCSVHGRAGQPVIFRNFRGERVVLQKTRLGDASPVLLVGNDDGSIDGSYTWWWGLEIVHPVFSPVVGWSGQYAEGEGVTMAARYVKIINCYIHDTPSNGIGCKKYGAGGEVYGTIILYAGRMITGPSHAYAIYTQSGTSAGEDIQRRFESNIIAQSWNMGVHAYTIRGDVDSLCFDGNAIFDNGFIWRRYFSWSINLGSTTPTIRADHCVVKNNHLYFSEEKSPASRHLFGSAGGTSDLVLTNNMISGGDFQITGAINPTVTGNWAYHTYPTGYSQTTYPDNVWRNSQYPLPRDSIFVLANRYERGRANLILYNWDESPSMSLNVSPVLQAKDSFVVKDPLNWNGPDVVRGRYTGSNITIPMRPRPVAPNVWDYDKIAVDPFSKDTLGHPFHTLPRFATFVLMPAGQVRKR